MMRWIVIAVMLVSAVARADNEPWKAGVTPERMDAAKKLLEQGNDSLVAGDWQVALAKYQAAIEQWDHPGIRFNVVKCLVQLDRTIEALDNLELALQYGAAPLDETVYGEALAYRKMLTNQVATIAVECKQPQVDATLDGQPLGACPGTTRRRVLPGPHQVVGKRAGFLTHTAEIVVLGGKTTTVALHLDPLTSGTIVHRWPQWVPWTVVGAGMLAGGLGGLALSSAITNRDAYEHQLTSCGQVGCPEGSHSGLKERAILENRVASGLFVTAGVAVVTGGVMIYMNRGRTVSTKQRERILPVASVTPSNASVGIAGSF